MFIKDIRKIQNIYLKQTKEYTYKGISYYNKINVLGIFIYRQKIISKIKCGLGKVLIIHI